MFGIERHLDARPSPNTQAIEESLHAALRDCLRPGTITLLCGPSGAGKSSLLRTLRTLAGEDESLRWRDLAELPLPDCPLTDCFSDAQMADVLLRLGRVGLGEAWTYLRTPSELSDGQRWRLRLALATHDAITQVSHTILASDEFAALLDRVSAAVVARALRRAVDDHAATCSAIVATSHEDLLPALRPDRLIRCDFGIVRFETPRA